MKEIGWSPLDVWAGFAHRKLMRSSGDSPQSGALSLECILGCWQNFSWATLAFDVESPSVLALTWWRFLLNQEWKLALSVTGEVGLLWGVLLRMWAPSS